jgi:hypothetical protein
MRVVTQNFSMDSGMQRMSKMHRQENYEICIHDKEQRDRKSNRMSYEWKSIALLLHRSVHYFYPVYFIRTPLKTLICRDEFVASNEDIDNITNVEINGF